MSVVPLSTTIALAAARGLIANLLIIPRNIAGFVADVTIEESHVDALEITQHPVEQGAAITDHAFKLPAMVTVRAGWTMSSLNALADPNYVNEVYSQFLELQTSRVPFTVVTGKRVYDNMLVSRLTTTTDKDTENSLILTVECREIILVNTQTVSVPDPSKMRSPQNNAATTNAGTKQLTSSSYTEASLVSQI